ncbi:MAG TPA: flippase-like domain-containing protein [Erysipelotrichaceae bacterium]|nr:flippase-like domain-containing protein [Erysipelotrichaceae bacterium]
MNNEEFENKVKEEEQIRGYDEPSRDKKSTLKYILNISFVLITTGLAIFIAIKDDAEDIWRYLVTADVKYLLIIISMMIGCVAVRSFILYCFAHLFTKKYHFYQAVAVDQVGVFYNAITPGSSGGQIMQAYTYKKQGVHISSAVSILAMYSIVFQTILIIFGTISFIVKYDFITSLGYIPTSISINDVPLNFPVWPLTIMGFILNVGVIAIVFLMGYWHGFHIFVMGPVVSFLHKIKLVKNPDRTRENLRIQVENFKIEFRRLGTNIPFLILVVVSFSLYMILKFSIPYFVGKALGNESPSASFWDSIFLSNYHQMITGLIPLPGSAGISEFVFYNLFMNEGNLTKGFFCAMMDGVPDVGATRSLCRSALVIWRSVTFVIPLLIAGFVAAFYRSSPENEAHFAGAIPNRQTFVSLQKETYEQRYEEVASLVETSRLSREAILAKLKPKKKKAKDKKPRKDSPADISKQDYDEVILDDLEDK